MVSSFFSLTLLGAAISNYAILTRSTTIQDGNAWECWKETATRDNMQRPCEGAVMQFHYHHLHGVLECTLLNIQGSVWLPPTHISCNT